MGIKIVFPGNKKVDAILPSGFVVHTDQPVRDGGDGTAPAPFELFLASIGTCAGIYIVGFCESRNIPYEDIEINQELFYDPVARRISKVKLEIRVPKDFPEKYYDALIKSANICAVKKTIENAPEFETVTVTK
ncbi:MAG: OsmC family protein [Ignavibacteria bacterium]|nr:OsmC family protein [Ignavibacteria bacterium]